MRFGGGLFLFHNKDASDLSFALSVPSPLTKYMLSSHFPNNWATFFPAVSSTNPLTCRVSTYLYIIWSKNKITNSRCIRLLLLLASWIEEMLWDYLVRIAVKNRLLLELEFAWILAITLDMHCSMVITVDIAKNQIVDAGCDLKLDDICKEGVH